MIFKCKPVYNFQSIEFEWEVPAGQSQESQDMFEAMFVLYGACIDKLKEIAPEQQKVQQVASKSATPKEEMATAGQVGCLVKLGYPKENAEKLTKKQASMKIKELLPND